MDNIRVLLVDDDERYVRTLAAFLESQGDLDVVGSRASGREAVEGYESLRPDVVVMDAYMPQMDGIEATRAILAAHPQARVIMLTAHDTDDLKARSSKVGASGFVSKHEAARELVDEIRRVAESEAAPADVDKATRLESELGEEGVPGIPVTRPPDVVVTVSVSVRGGGW